MESRGLSKLFIVNAKGLLKLILHFFLTYSYFLRSFLVFYRTIYNSHICSLYYSLVHFTIPCAQWRHLCANCLHSDRPHTSPMDPNFTFLCSTSSLPFQSHLLLAWPVTKKRKREKTGICHVEIDKKFCEKWYDKNFHKT